ncbi:MAG TPA: protein kinase [Candidatus Acidoferrales bacterium]|nr:protein kinase [Candidatus Acidoferrales bacterium]
MTKQSIPTRPVGGRDLTGKLVGRFAIDARLGAGGMGEVYRARDTKLRRTVALKRISGNLWTNEKSRERLWKEALCASRLNDPHIAAIHDAFEEQHEIFLVMEYVEGQSLRNRMRAPLSVGEFLPIAIQCVAGLAAAHRGGIQHRDIKPENILLTRDEQVKILDFGVARRLPGDTEGTTIDSLTNDGLIGTIIYMAPEIIEQRASDDRADVFSMGVVFYEALAGRHPFRGATFLESCQRIVDSTPPPVSKLNAEVPQKLDAIVIRMLAKQPSERYSSAAEVLEDLQDLQRERERKILSVPAVPETRKTLSGWKFWAVSAAGVALAAGGGLFAYAHFQKPALTEHAPILITDFENRTGQAVFDQTVTEAVRESLEESHYFRVIPRSQVHEAAQRMGRNDIGRVNRSFGREICMRENCRAVLAGTVVGTGPKYELTEELVDPTKDSAVLVETASMNSQADLYAAVDELTKKLRKGLGESLKQISQSSQPLAQVTTYSLAALQRYSQGLDLFEAGDIEGFLPLAQSAVSLDPNFAMAHLYLARAYASLGNAGAQQENLAAAMRGLDHVTDRERHLILAENYEVQESYEKAADEFRLLTEVYPDDMEGFRGLGEMSIWTGRPEEAVPAEQHALELSPHSAVDYLRLILYLDRLNRFDEALSAYNQAKANAADSPLLRWGTGLAYLGNGDTKSALHEFDLLENEGGQDGESLASLYRARVLMYQGRLKDAGEELRRGLLLDQKMNDQSLMPVRHYLLAEILMERRQTVEARAMKEELIREALADQQSEDMRRAGVIAIQLNDIPAARKLLSALGHVSEQHQSQFIQSCYYILDGSLDLAERHADTAAESQRKAAVFFPRYEAYAALGEALAATKDWKGASQAYEQYLGFEGEILQDDSPNDWVLAHLSLARALVRAGDTAQALKYYDQFLQLWSNGDHDLGLLEKARQERAEIDKGKQSGSGQQGTT